jgi:hypothetical protein
MMVGLPSITPLHPFVILFSSITKPSSLEAATEPSPGRGATRKGMRRDERKHQTVLGA